MLSCLTFPCSARATATALPEIRLFVAGIGGWPGVSSGPRVGGRPFALVRDPVPAHDPVHGTDGRVRERLAVLSEVVLDRPPPVDGGGEVRLPVRHVVRPPP